MSNQLFTKTGILSRFILRRDRLRIWIWLFGLVAITLLVAQTFVDLYGSEEERQAIAETMLNPAMTAMVGPAYGIDNYTIGAMFAHEMFLFTAIAFGLMSILLVARHTRADEEDGQIEMIRSLPTGRLSNLASTVLVMNGVNVLIALLIGFGLYGMGIESMDLEGSLLYGAALGATGIFFTAVTAVFAQLTENVRGTIGFAFTVLGVSYLVRAVGDVGNEMLSWLSPLGWVLNTEVFVSNYWWPLVLTIITALLLVLLAFYLNAIRDLGSGFLPAKSGRRHASKFLQSPLGLMVRLQRTSLIAWGIGMFILGASYGSVFGELETFFGDNEMLAELIAPIEGFSLTDQFIPMIMSIMAMLSTIPALMAMNKLIGEEKKNRTEHMLGRAVSRTRLIASSLVVSIVTSFVMLSLAAIGLWSAGNAVMEEGLEFGTLYGAAMVHLPAMWMIIGLAALFIGAVPKFIGLTWLYLIYSFIVVYLGGLLQLPDWLGNLSPFGQIPNIPVEDMDYMKVSILVVIAMFAAVIGFVGYNRRDIEG
ncbi:ABC transporter permease [Sporosarcina jiandibaonis]|uniref:ABC transporter permease n=1 Tax=Sporosarcina jiandibaonis TaxID=2715535 RepID=UPI0015547524|nr:ABC transporter permease [Sporosarcina jiandibaonis]